MTTPNTETPPPAPVASVDPNAIAAAVTAGMMEHQRALESAPKPMSDAERNEYLQVFDPTADGFVDEFVDAITSTELTPEQRAAAISRLRDGIANQSIRGAEILVDDRVNKLRAEFAPMLQNHAKSVAQQAQDTFIAAHPDLKEHVELANTVAIQLQQQGYRPASGKPEEALSRVAATVRTLLKLPEPAAPNPTPGATTMPRMTQTQTTSTPTGPPGAPTPTGVASFFLKRSR